MSNHRSNGLLAPIIRSGLCVLCGSILLPHLAKSAEPTVTARELPRLKPTEPRDALKTFQIKKGFHIELAACEPEVVSPVAMCFDENGRLFVCEMIDYSERREEKLGRIRMLEDTDGDGKFDKATIFAQGLPWPTAIFWANGGLFVAASPDIYFYRDSNNDGVADEKQTVFTGFGAGVQRLNVQALLNSFNWGLDNRIHGATSNNGGVVTSPLHADMAPLQLRGKDFAIDPRNMSMIAESGGGQHGSSFDTRGHRFVCSNSNHIIAILYDQRYAGRNPYFTMPPAAASIAVDGPAAEVYRTSPEENWRVIRTKWRVSGAVSGPIEGGGRSSGYFTGATGATIYTGNAYGPEFLNNAFIGDAGSNLVHRKLVRPDGVSFLAERPADEQKSEFLTSNDNWFRPVQMANAPDGCLYVIDMYREVIEHPWSLPESIKQYLDLNSGNDRGRIYRIAPDGFKQPAPVHLGSATTEQLVATLENPNGWHRNTAARLLYEQQNKSAVPLLTKLLEDSKIATARLHALHSLDGLAALTEPLLLKALDDPDPTVRDHAVLLSERLLANRVPSEPLWSKLRQLPADPDIHVRYQLAFTLGEINHAGRNQALAEIAKRDLDSTYVQAAILSSLAQGAVEVFAAISSDAALLNSPKGQDFLRQLALVIGAKNNNDDVAQIVSFLAKISDPASAFILTRAIGDGLQRSGTPLSKIPAIQSILQQAVQVAADAKATQPARIAALGLLPFTPYSTAGPTLLPLLDQSQAQPIQLAALHSLDHFTDPAVATELIQRYTDFTPRLRSETIALLAKRPDRASALLKAIQAGKIRPTDLSAVQQNFLRKSADAGVKSLAAKVLGAAPTSARAEVVKAFAPALDLKGDGVHGKSLFVERCASCHRLGGAGYALGPDLVTVKTSGKETMLGNILDPNKEVAPQYLAYLVDTKDGESLLGLVANETPTSLTLRQANGIDTLIQRSNIKRLKAQNQSLMPEGLEEKLKPQDLADLLEYITTAEADK